MLTLCRLVCQTATTPLAYRNDVVIVRYLAAVRKLSYLSAA